MLDKSIDVTNDGLHDVSGGTCPETTSCLLPGGAGADSHRVVKVTCSFLYLLLFLTMCVCV